MFSRKENRRLLFNRLEFEIIIADIFEGFSPNSIDELKWMVARMIDSIQLCAWEYADSRDDLAGEWEDICYVEEWT